MFILEVSYGCPSEKYPMNGNFQMDQAKALRDLGHKIVFCAIDMRSIRRTRKWGFQYFLKDEIPVYESNIPFGPLVPNLKSKFERLSFNFLLGKIIKKHGKPDIVHVHFGDTAKCVVDACKKYDVPYVVTEHGSSVAKIEKGTSAHEKYKKVYENAAKIISVSSFLRKNILEKFSTDAVVVHNIVDTDIFKLSKSKKEAKETFKLVAAGNLIDRKGFDVLLSAYAEFAKNNPQSTLCIMGDGPEKESLKNLAQKLGVEAQVNFLGKYTREEFSHELQSSDAFVLASRHETFGVVYVEALANGVPVIATSCNGPEDFVNDDCGIIVPVDGIAQLSKAMQKVKDNINNYNSVAIADYAKNKFSPEVIAKQITEVFEDVLNG